MSPRPSMENSSFSAKKSLGKSNLIGALEWQLSYIKTFRDAHHDIRTEDPKYIIEKEPAEQNTTNSFDQLIWTVVPDGHSLYTLNREGKTKDVIADPVLGLPVPSCHYHRNYLR